MVGGLEILIAGAVIGIRAIGVLFAAIVAGIAALLVYWGGMGTTVANSLASLIVFIVAGLIAWALVVRGRSALSSANMRPDRTAHSLAADAAAAKERL